MIEKRTTVQQIEITAGGFIQVRFALDLVEDGKVIQRQWHRTAIEPGGDVDAQIVAVNANLAQMGKNAVPVPDVTRVKQHASVAWSPEIVSAYRVQAVALLAKL